MDENGEENRRLIKLVIYIGPAVFVVALGFILIWLCFCGKKKRSHEQEISRDFSSQEAVFNGPRHIKETIKKQLKRMNSNNSDDRRHTKNSNIPNVHCTYDKEMKENRDRPEAIFIPIEHEQLLPKDT